MVSSDSARGGTSETIAIPKAESQCQLEPLA